MTKESLVLLKGRHPGLDVSGVAVLDLMAADYAILDVVDAGKCSRPSSVGLCTPPALNAAVADVVPLAERPRAFGLVYWTANVGFGFGYALAGVVGTHSLPALFALDAATTCAFALETPPCWWR